MTVLSQFIESVTKDRDSDLTISFQMADNGLPVNIYVRYDAVGLRYRYTSDHWTTFKMVVTEKSRSTMFLTTDEILFSLGIINIAVACQNRNLQPEDIVDAVKWIKDEFFPAIDMFDEKNLDFLIKNVTVENALHQPQRFVIEEYEDHILLKKLQSTGIERVDIPEEINEKPVTVIGVNCFSNCQDLTEINMPDSILSIESSAFGLCRSLEEITLPKNLKSLGRDFIHDTRIEKIEIPSGVTVLPKGVFAYAKQLREVVLHDGLKRIEGYAFFMTQVGEDKPLTIPNTVETIETSAFYNDIGMVQLETDLPIEIGWFLDWPYGEAVICSAGEGIITNYRYMESGCYLHQVTIGSDKKTYFYPCDYLNGDIAFVDPVNQEQALYEWDTQKKIESAEKVKAMWEKGLIASD